MRLTEEKINDLIYEYGGEIYFPYLTDTKNLCRAIESAVREEQADRIAELEAQLAATEKERNAFQDQCISLKLQLAELKRQEPVATVEERRELRKIYGSDMGLGCSDGFVTDVYKVAVLTNAGRFLESGTPLYAAPVVPAGVVMVPMEPTQAMLDAGCEVDLEEETAEHYLAYIKAIYERMIAAAQEEA